MALVESGSEAMRRAADVGIMGTGHAEAQAAIALRQQGFAGAEPTRGVRKVVVIGDGYIGLGAAAMLTELGEVTLIEALPRVLARVCRSFIRMNIAFTASASA